MRILVTGNAGFIGQNFVRLFKDQYELYGIDKLGYASDHDAMLHCSSFIVNTTDEEELENALESFREEDGVDVFDVCINFAAESHVDNSIAGPRTFVDSNIIGTFNMLEQARRGKIKRFIQISTDEVYGDLEKYAPHFPDVNLLKPSNPYSATKAAADMLVMSYVRTYNLDATIIRMCNNYGPHQYAEKLIPVIIENASKNKKIPVYGTGKNMREWIYVEDACKAIEVVLRLGKSGEIYDIGSRFELENIELVKTILQLMNKPESLIEYVEDRKGHDMRYFLDSSKIRNKLGWKPEVPFQDGLKRTIDFYWR